MAVLDDEPDDSISCSPAILTLHTSHPSSSPQSSSSSSSSSSDAQTLPVPISIPHEHKSQNRKRALSAPPYYKPSQLTVHNNPSLSITHSPPKNPPPAVKVVPPKLVIAPPKSTTSPPQQEKQTKAKKVIDISDDASDDDFSRKSNNNNDNSSDNKSDDSDNSTHSSSSSSQDNKHHKKNNYNNSKSKKYDKATNNINKFKYKTHSENKYESDGSDVEVAKIDFGLSSSDSSDAENTKMKEKRSNKNESHSSSSSSKNKRKHDSDDDVAHHCHHSDGDYADPDPKPTKKYKKGMKKWDQKRHFIVPTFGDEDAPDDSYAAKVKRSIDEIYRIPDDGETPISISKDTVREMYVVGQADNKFVVTRAGNILFMVDQHAADERVRLERLETAVGSASGCGQFTLAKPQKWALAPHEARAAESYKSQLENWGFRWDVSSSDENMLIVRQIPTLFDTKLTMHDFREFIAQLDETKGSNHTRPNAITRILNFKACRGAVMFGDPLSQAECGVLIDQVSQCKLPFQCAHGRPSMHPVIDMTKLPPTPPPKPRRGLGGLLLLPPP